jgi:hypothetical protein
MRKTTTHPSIITIINDVSRALCVTGTLPTLTSTAHKSPTLLYELAHNDEVMGCNPVSDVAHFDSFSDAQFYGLFFGRFAALCRLIFFEALRATLS